MGKYPQQEEMWWDNWDMFQELAVKIIRDTSLEMEPAMIRRVFLDHPASVDETYLEHTAFALKFSGQLFLAAFAALLHAFVPAACEKTASRIVARLYAKTHNRGQ